MVKDGPSQRVVAGAGGVQYHDLVSRRCPKKLVLQDFQCRNKYIEHGHGLQNGAMGSGDFEEYS